MPRIPKEPVPTVNPKLNARFLRAVAKGDRSFECLTDAEFEELGAVYRDRLQIGDTLVTCWCVIPGVPIKMNVSIYQPTVMEITGDERLIEKLVDMVLERM